ncbi:MAG: LamG-like jellyroll fold domain-containing protein, partial [Thermoproteota archaeon]
MEISPQIIEDFKLDNADNVEILGDIKSENKSEVIFDGGQIIENDGDSTKELLHFTISSWVKPDYDKGSADFTIISKEKTFALGIHNVIPPSKIAWFTVFDGIKWNTVTSSTEISEEWTNIVATYDGALIRLYVNGNLENTLDISIPYFTIYGKFLEIPRGSLESDSELTIGGTHIHSADTHEVSNLYSGKINQIVLLNSTLTDEQISAEYAKDLPQCQSLDKELSIEELTEIIRQEQNQTSTSITSQNYTLPEILEPAVSPQLVPADGNFMITEDAELHLEFYSESDSLLKELSDLDSATTSLLVETQQIMDSIDVNSAIIPNPLGFLFELERLIPNADGAQPNDIEILKTSLIRLQSELSNLKSKIEELKATENLDINDIKEIKAQLKETINEIKSIASQLEKANLKSQGTDLKSSADSAEKTNDLVTPEKQQGKWKDNEGEINTKILDSHGNPANLNVSYEKIVDGKFNLRISPNSDTKPGIYKIISTITVNGKEHIVESEFAWGLVSLNTKKSTYKPGETADFVIVVLDNQGHPIGDANISMDITDPNSQITHLSSENGIIPGDETGLYDAEFVTGDEGTYTVEINAKSNGIDTNFSTTFDVKSFVEFNIIRTAQSKIDPTTNPNSFDVIIDIESFVGGETVTIQESVPKVFDVKTDGKVQIVGDKKIITWDRDLVDNKTSIKYSYSVPYDFPSLYDLGPLQITYENGQTFYETRPWFVANDPNVDVAGVPTTPSATLVPVSDVTCSLSGGTKWTTTDTTTCWANIDDDTDSPGTDTITAGTTITAETVLTTTTATIKDSTISVYASRSNTAAGWAVTVQPTWQYANGTDIAVGSAHTLTSTPTLFKTDFTSLLSTPGSGVATQLLLTVTYTGSGGSKPNTVINAANVDVIHFSNNYSVSLTDNLGITDSVAKTRTAAISLTDNLGITDSVAKTRTA